MDVPVTLSIVTLSMINLIMILGIIDFQRYERTCDSLNDINHKTLCIINLIMIRGINVVQHNDTQHKHKV
jgi:hypothetical protein